MRIVANKTHLTIYHGDNFGTSKLEPKLMNNGNNELGIGIYFGNRDTADSYGKYIISTEINPKKFVEARDDASKHIKKDKLVKLLRELHNMDDEPLYYAITDYGIEVEPDEVEDIHLDMLAGYMLEEEMRNLQIDLAQKFSNYLIEFVKEWNRIIKIDGTKMDRGGEIGFWFCIINPKYKVTKVQL